MITKSGDFTDVPEKQLTIYGKRKKNTAGEINKEEKTSVMRLFIEVRCEMI